MLHGEVVMAKHKVGGRGPGKKKYRLDQQVIVCLTLEGVAELDFCSEEAQETRAAFIRKAINERIFRIRHARPWMKKSD